MNRWNRTAIVFLAAAILVARPAAHQGDTTRIGDERAAPHQLHGGEEFGMTALALVDFACHLFTASWRIKTVPAVR